MLEEWKFDRKKLDEAECKVRLKARRLDLAGLQQPIKGAGLPVIVLIEGWGASGKGSMIRSLIRELDPLSDQTDFFTFCPSYSRSICIGAATRFLYDFVNQL